MGLDNLMCFLCADLGDIPCCFTKGFKNLCRFQNMHALWKNPKSVEKGQFMRKTPELMKGRTKDVR